MASVPSHLLLLPPPPWPPSPDNLRAAYHDALTSTLEQIAQEIRSATTGAGLDIALPVPLLHKCPDAPRGQIFEPVQALVAGIYKLICVIAAREKINVEDAEGIDARVLLIAYPRGQDGSSGESKADEALLGPVITFEALNRSQRSWRSVFAVDGEAGEQLLKQFTTGQDARVKIQRVPSGPIALTAEEVLPENKSATVHTSVIVGGTWDHIHIGHKLLLTLLAFLVQPRQSQPAVITIGTTGDELLQNKKHAELLESWHERQKSARTFLSRIMDFRPSAESNVKEHEISNPGPNGHAVFYEMDPALLIKTVEISDPYGPTITDEAITAIIVSAETRSGGKAVNEKRREKGWHELEIFEIDVLDPNEATVSSIESAFESKISSTAIRQALSERGKLRSKA